MTRIRRCDSDRTARTRDALAARHTDRTTSVHRALARRHSDQTTRTTVATAYSDPDSTSLAARRRTAASQRSHAMPGR